MDDLNLQEIAAYGQDTGKGNLLGIQPFMRRLDYASETSFHTRLTSYFRLAADRGWINARTVVVLPEYLGTWLVAAGESAAAISAPTIEQAMRSLVLGHLPSFAGQMLRAKEKNRVNASLFRLKAPEMARIYSAVFSSLAKEYQTTIVAGSILLPNPQVIDGQVVPGKGNLYNTSFVFHPDGRADQRIARKSFPTADERPFVDAAPVNDLPVFETPAGRLGVLVCADSWFPEAYQCLRSQNVDLLAVPSASSPAAVWDKPWKGYSGWPETPDIDRADILSLTERQAWEKYAIAGRIASAGAKAGINVFLFGDLWDLDFGGGRWRVVCGEMNIEGSDGPALVNLWL
jgi:predicted amidohydrolase